MAIKIDFLSDVSKVVGDTDKLAENYLNVSDSLKDLANDSERATDRISDSFKDAGNDVEKLGDKIGDSTEDGFKEAESSADRFKKDVDAAFDAVSKDADAAGKKVGKSQDDGFRKAKGSVDEFRNEANSTAKESAASFDGSAESIIGSFQEVAANAFEGFGPAGTVAGLAAAVGIGIAVTKLQAAAEANDELKTKVGELAQEFYDAGGALDEAAIKTKIEDIAFALAKEDVWYKWGDQARTGAELVMEALDGISTVDAQKVFEGLAGNVESGQKAFDDLTASIEADQEALEELNTTTATGRVVLSEEGEALKKSIARRQDLRDEIEKATGASADAAAATEYFTETMGESTEAVEARREAQAKLKDANLSLAESDIAMAESFDTLTDTLHENGEEFDINTEAGRANRKAILDHVEAINTSTESQLEAGESVASVTERLSGQRDALLQQIQPYFENRQAAEQYIEQVLKTPAEVSTDVNLAGTGAAEDELNHLARNRSTTVDVDADTRAAEYAIAVLNGRRVTVHADFVARPGVPVFY